MSQFSADFSFYQNQTDQEQAIYLDNAATSQRLSCALQASREYYSNYNANVHRGAYESAREATERFEQVRASLALFLGVDNCEEIVLTSGATESLNIIANGLSPSMLSGKIILVCESEHHANLLPWQLFAKKYGFQLQRIPLSKNGEFSKNEMHHLAKLFHDGIAIVAIAHASNALGNVYPVKEICQLAKKCNAISVIDGTQAVAHSRNGIQEIGCDFYAFSGHKMYAPTGTGGFYGRYSLLKEMQPSKVGGEMIKSVSFDAFEVQDPPLKFEAGTPNIGGAIGLAEAAEYCHRHRQDILSHETNLYQYLLSKLLTIKDLRVYGNRHDSLPIVAFNIDNYHCNDIASYLASKGIAVRAGHHCCMPLMSALGIDGCVRVSLACYNQIAEIDALIAALQEYLAINDTDPTTYLSGHVSDQVLEQVSKQVQSTDPLKKSINAVVSAPLGSASSASQDDTKSLFLSASGWNNKHRLLLLLSKRLPILAQNERIDAHKINGCEASVWLKLQTNSGLLTCFAYSNSKVVRGLLFVILDKINQLDKDDIAPFDFEAYLVELGLYQFFSQGRRDGILQIISAIKQQQDSNKSSL